MRTSIQTTEHCRGSSCGAAEGRTQPCMEESKPSVRPFCWQPRTSTPLSQLSFLGSALRTLTSPLPGMLRVLLCSLCPEAGSLHVGQKCLGHSLLFLAPAAGPAASDGPLLGSLLLLVTLYTVLFPISSGRDMVGGSGCFTFPGWLLSLHPRRKPTC